MPTATLQTVSAEIVARFWVKVQRESPSVCWEWTASRTLGGYGQMKFGGRLRLAHRIAWILTYGDIPDNLCVCHRCDNPPCVNPNHLFLGTVAENLADAQAKGRRNAPDAPRTRKLTYADRVAIFFSSARTVDLARRYGVSTATVHHTRIGRFAGAPRFQRIDAGTEHGHDFHQLLEQFHRADVSHVPDGNAGDDSVSSHIG